MPDNNYRPEGDPLGGSTQIPGSDDMAAVTPVGVTIVEGDENDDERDFVPPKGRLGGTIALGVSQSIDNSEGGVSKTFFPQIMNAFGLSDAELGLLNAMGNAARMIFGPLWAILADRFGRKLILFIVTGLWGLWTIGAAFAQSWPMLLVIYGISLVGTVASEPILNGLLGSLYKRSERGKAFGTVRATSSALGFIMTPALGQFGGDPNGWRIAFIALGILSVVSGILILIFVHEPKKVAKDETEELKSEAGMFKLADAAKLFKIPTVTLIAPMLLLVTSLVLFGFMGQVWARDMGYGVKNGSYLYTAFQIGAMLSALMGGFLADAFVKKFGHKGRIMLFQIYCVIFGTIIAITMYFYRAWTPGIQSGNGQEVLQDPSIVYYLLVFLMGLVFSIGFSGCVLPMVSSVVPKQLAATSFALLFSLIQGGINVVYSLVLGNVSKAIGSLPLTILLLVSLPYFINAAYWFLFYRTYPKDVELQAERTALIEQGKF